MNITEVGLNGLCIIEPTIYRDDRGYFYEVCKDLDTLTIPCSADGKRYETFNFRQENESMSFRGVVRGLHYQIGDFKQSKLVRVIKGSVYDVALDIRRYSPTFGQWFGVELSAENKKMFFIPKGFAHGFIALEDYTIFNYKVDNLYDKESERCINAFDPQLGIDWKLDCTYKANLIKQSDKDKIAPMFSVAQLW